MASGKVAPGDGAAKVVVSGPVVVEKRRWCRGWSYMTVLEEMWSLFRGWIVEDRRFWQCGISIKSNEMEKKVYRLKINHET